MISGPSDSDAVTDIASWVVISLTLLSRTITSVPEGSQTPRILFQLYPLGADPWGRLHNSCRLPSCAFDSDFSGFLGTKQSFSKTRKPFQIFCLDSLGSVFGELALPSSSFVKVGSIVVEGVDLRDTFCFT